MLTGYKTSPYFRLIHALCLELDIDCDLDIITFLLKATPEEMDAIKQKNPLMKIPILVDGDTTIMDSRIIANYLLNKVGDTGDISFPLSIEDENRLSVIYGMLDSGILRFIMSHGDTDMDEGYMKRSYERIGESLTFLSKQTFEENKFGLPEMLLVCALEWFDKRQVYDWKTFPEIQKIYAFYKERASLIETRIPKTA